MDLSRDTLTGGNFQWDDPLLVEQELGEEERLIAWAKDDAGTVRGFIL